MNEEMAVEARNKAGHYFKEGYNCAESIFLTYRELLEPDMDVSMVRLVTGLGGGLGRSGCVCGALSASIIALNMIKGRTSNKASRDESYKLAKEFTEKFKEKFGATCCRVLSPYSFQSQEHRSNCLKITGNTSKMLMEFLEENGLLKQG